jgi:hypothetical protein
MKILIVSTGRSGSSNLFKGLLNSLNQCKGYYEPNNPECSTLYNNNEGKIDFLNKNIVVKILSHHFLPINKDFLLEDIYKDFYTHHFHNSNLSYLHQKLHIFYNLFFPHFDKIILLARQNEIENAKSWAHIFENDFFGKDAHKPYFSNSSSNNYLKFLPLVRNYNDLIYQTSTNYNIPITYYEDIFTEDQNKIQNFLDLNGIKLDKPSLFFETLNPKNKYKQN